MRQPPNLRKKRSICENTDSGFTLIEVLVAIIILTIGLLGMASLTVGVIKGNKLSKDLTTATTLAQDRMEILRSLPFNDVISDPKAACDPPFEMFDIEVEVDQVSNTVPTTQMKQVTVTVSWTDTAGEHNIPIRTIFSQ